MSSLTTGNAEQYSNSQKLAARARLASNYAISEQPWFPWVASLLPLKAGDRILDVGCGPGWFWEAVADVVPAGIDVTLTDLSAGMVEEAKMRCSPLPLSVVDSQVADAAALPFETETFDGVLAMHMLYHMPDPSVAISEMFRVLKPGGFIAVTTNGVNSRRGLYELTTVFGGTPYDPAAAVFGSDEAERQLREQFGNVDGQRSTTPMRVTSVEDVFLGLTSYPPPATVRIRASWLRSGPLSKQHSQREMEHCMSQRKRVFSSLSRRKRWPTSTTASMHRRLNANASFWGAKGLSGFRNAIVRSGRAWLNKRGRAPAALIVVLRKQRCHVRKRPFVHSHVGA